MEAASVQHARAGAPALAAEAPRVPAVPASGRLALDVVSRALAGTFGDGDIDLCLKFLKEARDAITSGSPFEEYLMKRALQTGDRSALFTEEMISYSNPNPGRCAAQNFMSMLGHQRSLAHLMQASIDELSIALRFKKALTPELQLTIGELARCVTGYHVSPAFMRTVERAEEGAGLGRLGAFDQTAERLVRFRSLLECDYAGRLNERERGVAGAVYADFLILKLLQSQRMSADKTFEMVDRKLSQRGAALADSEALAIIKQRASGFARENYSERQFFSDDICPSRLRFFASDLDAARVGEISAVFLSAVSLVEQTLIIDRDVRTYAELCRVIDSGALKSSPGLFGSPACAARLINNSRLAELESAARAAAGLSARDLPATVPLGYDLAPLVLEHLLVLNPKLIFVSGRMPYAAAFEHDSGTDRALKAAYQSIRLGVQDGRANLLVAVNSAQALIRWELEGAGVRWESVHFEERSPGCYVHSFTRPGAGEVTLEYFDETQAAPPMSRNRARLCFLPKGSAPVFDGAEARQLTPEIYLQRLAAVHAIKEEPAPASKPRHKLSEELAMEARDILESARTIETNFKVPLLGDELREFVPALSQIGNRTCLSSKDARNFQRKSAQLKRVHSSNAAVWNLRSRIAALGECELRAPQEAQE
jgi:hypothetical protein